MFVCDVTSRGQELDRLVPFRFGQPHFTNKTMYVLCERHHHFLQTGVRAIRERCRYTGQLVFFKPNLLIRAVKTAVIPLTRICRWSRSANFFHYDSFRGEFACTFRALRSSPERRETIAPS